MNAYLSCVGRTPKVKVLELSKDKTQVLIQETNIGNPLETEQSSGPSYWVDERRLFARLSRSGLRYTLEGRPDYMQLSS